MNRKECLLAAEQCILHDRQDQYNRPENNFQTIAHLWEDYLNAQGQSVELAPHDVAVMMALLKIARIATGKPKEDNFVDLCGYSACACELQTGEQRGDERC